MTETYLNSEKQLITTLSWFRSRYALYMGLTLDRKADWESIEAFGRVWIGGKKENWENALKRLMQIGVIEYFNEEYRLTENGEKVKAVIDSDAPFYMYEYDNYFDLEHKSRAHSEFCERVYGMDMSQHGLADLGELKVMIDKINQLKPISVLDIGCGNGRITEWISEQTQIACTGIDISGEAIKLANARVTGKDKLHFYVGNLNHIYSTQAYDCILFLDTLYYADSLSDTLKKSMQLLTPKGRILAYFSQWIMDEYYKENLLPDNTHLAKVLRELKINYSYIDLTKSGLNHWKKKLEVLNRMKVDFLKEGQGELWEYRYREANRYANWGDNKYSRYLYEIKPD